MMMQICWPVPNQFQQDIFLGSFAMSFYQQSPDFVILYLFKYISYWACVLHLFVFVLLSFSFWCFRLHDRCSYVRVLWRQAFIGNLITLGFDLFAWTRECGHPVWFRYERLTVVWWLLSLEGSFGNFKIILYALTSVSI